MMSLYEKPGLLSRKRRYSLFSEKEIHTNAAQRPHKQTKLTQPWELLAPLARGTQNLHVQSWWELTGSVLGILMEEAEYDVKSQYLNLLFHLRYIVPRLGLSPNFSRRTTPIWRSFMTDDFSPLEYSWNWDTPKKGPKIRYSVETIGAGAGTANDTFNQASCLRLRNEIKRDIPATNFNLFNMLRDAFCDHSQSLHFKHRGTYHESSPSSLFLAFELGQSIATKAYFVPVKAEQNGIPRLEVVTEAISLLRAQGLPFEGYDKLLEFCDTRQGRKLTVIGVAIDCVSTEDTRFKIYLRSPESSFQSVCDMMTMGGTLDTFTGRSRTDLKDLWRLTLGLDAEVSESEELPCADHETAGVLYNFDIRPRGTSTEAKLYVPVRHYASSDLAAARGLGEFLRAKGRDRYFERYMRALERICTHRELGSSTGLQTYIGTGVKSGQLALCSYINAEAYHPGRW